MPILNTKYQMPNTKAKQSKPNQQNTTHHNKNKKCGRHGEHLHKPIRAWAPIIIRSSSLVHPPFLMDGSSWLNHLSRHCLPMRPGMRSAISDHLVIPALIHAIIVWSSSFVHRPLTRPGLKACEMSRGCPIRRCMRIFFLKHHSQLK